MATFVMLLICGTVARADEPSEAQLGAQLFAELKSQGEIVKASPLYDSLAPIAAAITKVVQPQYPYPMYPIHFYIVHEKQPNAFAAPGGNVYVIDSLLYFVKNTEELAGTLCHETSHLLHHDSMELMKRNEAIRNRAIGATILLGPTIGTALAIGAIARLDANHYSRDAEEAADLTGSDTCAAAGYNPWGLVWLFQDFSNANMKAPPEILSDHPNNAHRVARLKAHTSRGTPQHLRSSMLIPSRRRRSAFPRVKRKSFFANAELRRRTRSFRMMPLPALAMRAANALVVSVVVAGVALCCFVLVKAQTVVLVFFAAIIISEAIRPLVDRLAKHVNRSLAIALALLALAAAGAAAVALLTRTLRPQLASSLQALSRYASEIAPILQIWLGSDVRDQFARFITGNAAPIGMGLIEAQKFIASAISVVVLVVLMAAFWLSSSDSLCNSVLVFVPTKLRSPAQSVFHEMGSTLGLYAGCVLVNGQSLRSAARSSCGSCMHPIRSCLACFKVRS